MPSRYLNSANLRGFLRSDKAGIRQRSNEEITLESFDRAGPMRHQARDSGRLNQNVGTTIAAQLLFRQISAIKLQQHRLSSYRASTRNERNDRVKQCNFTSTLLKMPEHCSTGIQRRVTHAATK